MTQCCPLGWIKFFKAACDNHRQKMLTLIEKHQSLNASQIIEKVHLSQPAVSHHLKILLEAKLIKANKVGKEVHYSIDKATITNCCGSFMKKFS